LLVAFKNANLDAVKQLRKQYGFTATQPRGWLATKGERKPASDAVAENPLQIKAKQNKNYLI
jgi:hypothetical protein